MTMNAQLLSNKLDEAVGILNEGGIGIFPTDTAFGIGCRIDNIQAVKRLFKIRNRPEDKATPVLVDSLKTARKYWLSPLPNIVRRLAESFWPGGLTIVYAAKTGTTPLLVRGGGKNVGLRMPDHETVLNLLTRLGVPLLGPSANFHGHNTPYTFNEVDPDIIKLVDFVIPGECKSRVASTVVDCSGKIPRILRQGKVELPDEFIKHPKE